MQFRIGLSPGRARVRAAAAAAAAAPPPPPAAAPVHTLTVEAECNPCTVEVGKTLDGDGDGAELDRLRGDLSVDGADRDAGAAGRSGQTLWTAPHAGRQRAGDGDGDVPDRQQDGDATRSTSMVTRAAGADDHVRGRVLRLRPLLAAAGSDAGARRSGRRRCARTRRCGVEIEGHTCNIGTAEYNLALGRPARERGAGLPDQPRRSRPTGCAR